MGDIKLVIVEDEPLIAADLENQLTKLGIQVIGMFESGQEIMDFLKLDDKPDVIIMDIQIYGPIDGIDVANFINSNYHIPVIFLTSNTDSSTFNRAKLSFPPAFLSKPFRINDVMHAIELACENMDQDSDKEVEYLSDRIFIKTADSLVRVLFSQVFYIEADGAYTRLVTADKEYLLTHTLKKVEDKIIPTNFVKIHRSFIANLNNVDRITEGFVHFGEFKIPVSRGYRDEVLKSFRTL